MEMTLTGGGRPAVDAMNWLKKLNNPLALIVQGFAAGAILFVASNPSIVRTDSHASSAQSEKILADLTR